MPRPKHSRLRALAFCATLLSAQPSGAINSPEIFENQLPKEPRQTALCVVDVNQATYSLAQAGLAIRAATRWCEKPVLTAFRKSSCAVSISNVLTSLALTADFLAAAASNCGPTLNLPAYCASDVSNLVGSMAVVASGAASMSQSCEAPDRIGGLRRLEAQGIEEASHNSSTGDVESALRTLEEGVAAPLRQLEAWPDNLKKAAAKLQAFRQDRNAQIAECVFDSVQSAAWLARAGLAIDGAVRDCDTTTQHLAGESGKMLCSVDVGGVIGSFAWVARSLSLAVVQCPLPDNAKAQCAADIVAVIAGLAGIAASGSSLTLTCSGGAMGPPEVGWATTRRLGPAHASATTEEALLGDVKVAKGAKEVPKGPSNAAWV